MEDVRPVSIAAYGKRTATFQIEADRGREG